SEFSKHTTGNRSQLINFVIKFLGTVIFRNDHIVKIMGYGDYQMGNVIISQVYYVEGLGCNLFPVGKFCDFDLKVAIHKHSCFIRDFREPNVSTRTPSSTTIDQDALSTNNNPYVDSTIPEPSSEESSTQVVIPNNVPSINQLPEHINKWTEDNPIDNVIGHPSRPVFTQHQLQDEALLCYFDAFLSFVEPNRYKEALTESCWIEAMQEELNVFEHLEV
nr:integrase, catalytic region, zinc finger, CCHC-type, peptidase aspartic, catalytic [Tanacetum cinerariifolium]GEY43414.1 integrase, catalytic region, zinc finger, CCHC-type, peptidase aspartic, catalytic [Tanacetum cinerariifolium]